MPVTESVRQEMRAYLDENFLYMHPGVKLADDDYVLANGVVDSLGLLEIVDEVQRRYGIEVRDLEITEENFGSIDAIAQFVAAKQAAS